MVRTAFLRYQMAFTHFMSGGAIYVHALSKSFLIVNSLKVAQELLDKRGANYSDRPTSILYDMYELPVTSRPRLFVY